MNLPSSAVPPALVVIDMQNAFRDAASQWCVPRYQEIVPAISALAEHLNAPPIFTRFVPDPREPGAWRGYYDRWNEMRQHPDASGWDITLDVPGNSPIVSKPTFSKWGPELEALIPMGQDLILTGVATDCCVLSTALGAIDAGRHVTVVADACAAVSDTAQEQTLALLELLSPLVTVVTSRELIAVPA